MPRREPRQGCREESAGPALGRVRQARLGNARRTRDPGQGARPRPRKTLRAGSARRRTRGEVESEVGHVSLGVPHSRALAGLHAPEVTVEVHLGNGLPSFTIVGLPDTEVKESRDRVRAALVNSRFDFPARRITVNLAPAELPKESGRYDLPIELGILAASHQLQADGFPKYEFAGELSLTGELRPVRGALAMTWRAARDGRAFVLPPASAYEAALVSDASIYQAGSLLDVCAHLAGRQPLARPAAHPVVIPPNYPDLAEVKGQAQAKRALEVAAAGGHSVLMVGPPRTGKAMLAARFPGPLPPMNSEEALESAAL